MASPSSSRKRALHGRVAERRPQAGPRLDSPEFYLNPHLSLLAFQRRVLEEAQDPATPLLERVKFLSILGSNMDEFFMVRVAGLWQQIETRTTEISMDGRSPSEQLELIRQEVTSIMAEIYRLWREDLMPDLRAEGIYILGVDELNPQQRVAVDEYFKRVVYPVLTPLAVDQGRPFPHISNLSLNIAAVVSNGDGMERFARIKVPDTLPQLVPLPSSASELAFIWLEHAITCNLRMLFPEMEILSSYMFHLTRDAELAIQELETDDLLESVQEAVWRRRFRDAVRLQVDMEMPQRLIDILTANLELDQNDVYRCDGPLDLSRVRALLSIDRPNLKDKPFIASPAEGIRGVAVERDFHDHLGDRCAGASAFRNVSAGGGFSASRGGRPACTSDQDDAVPGGAELADCRSAARCDSERQASRGSVGIESAL